MRLLSLLLLVFVAVGRGESLREQRLAAEIERDPRNVGKVLELAALKLDDATAISSETERADALDAVQILYLRAQALDPKDVDALYHLGMVSWMKVFPAVVAARREAAMEPETPGPVRDRSSRAVLNAKYRADIEYAIATLEQAIALDPGHNPAMAYLQMAYRARADFKDSRVQWEEDQTAAGRWREKAYDVGMAKQAELAALPVPAADPRRAVEPEPSISWPVAAWAVAFFPTALVVDGAEMDGKLLHSMPAVCPAAARVVGQMPPVTFSAVIDLNGSVVYLERLAGPVEGAESAMEAAKHWVYRPTLVNGHPVLVKTTIEVGFGPCPQG